MLAQITNWTISRIYMDRYSERVQVDRAAHSLTLTHLRPEDSGIYQVEAVTGDEFIKTYNITVYVPVSPPKVSSVPSENGSCSLFCSVENDTQVTVFWQKGGNSRILLLEKQEADKQYTCVAENSFSQENITVTTEEMCGWKDEDGENVQPRSHYIISTVIAAACILIAIVLIVCLRRKLLQKEGSTRSRNGDDLQYAEVILHERGSKQQNLRELGASQETKSKLTTVYGKISYAPPLTE
ncbi:SLAM family member 5-like isoform X9 [Erpetoichthys calabaricus]|uniref:SLAM family member 5-like isoform X9 n=1 Tax=Erpetoichthys calabaricus TaxID=27687 RepID=UPI002234E33B|nr:SLAM family member 5-like isoform X9 [Erpetoichthys calabaricus]